MQYSVASQLYIQMLKLAEKPQSSEKSSSMIFFFVCVKISSLIKHKNELSLWFLLLSVYLFYHLLGNLQSF